MNKLSDKLAVCDQSMIYEEEEVERFNQNTGAEHPVKKLTRYSMFAFSDLKN